MRSHLFTIVAVALLCTVAASGQMRRSRERAILSALNELGTAGEKRVEEIQQGLLQMGEAALPYLKHALELSPDPKVRYQAALIIGNMRLDEGVKPLFLASQLDRDSKVREGAGLALENLVTELKERRLRDRTFRRHTKATRSMVIALKRTLKSDRDPVKRINAAETLGRVGKKTDLDDILKIVLDDISPRVRQAMIRAAEKLAYPEMLQINYRVIYFRTTSPWRKQFRMRLTDRFLDIIANEEEIEVKKAGIESLTRLVYPIFVLGEGLLSSHPGYYDENKYIIERVTLRYVGMLTDPAYVEARALLLESVTKLLNAYFRRGDTSLDDEVRRRLITEVQDYAGEYRVWALPFTVRMEYDKKYSYTPLKKSFLADRARKIFVQIFLYDREAENRRLAAVALTTLGRKKDVNDIVARLSREKSPEVILAGVEAIGRIDSLSGAKWLYTVVRNRNAPAQVRVEAVIAIGLVNNVDLTRSLASYYYKVKDFQIRKAIIEAMRFSSDREVARFLIRALGEEAEELRRAAAESLSKNRTDAAIPTLRHLLKRDPSARVRAAVVVSLHKNDPNNAQKLIIQALSDTSPIVRRAAAVELGIMEAKDAYDELAAVMLKDSDPDVRLEAARSLGYVGNQYTVAPLIQSIINDKQEAVREEALRSLIFIRRPSMGIVAIMGLVQKVRREDPEAAWRLEEAEYYLRLQKEGYLRRK